MQISGGNRMTDSQKTSLQEIISNYDSDNFSQKDFEAMEDELKSAGIGRTREAKSMLEDAGFDITQYAKNGPGAGQGPGGPPQGQGGLNLQALQSFQEILDDYSLENMSSEDQENLLTDLTDSGLLQSGLIMNISA